MRTKVNRHGISVTTYGKGRRPGTIYTKQDLQEGQQRAVDAVLNIINTDIKLVKQALHDHPGSSSVSDLAVRVLDRTVTKLTMPVLE